MFRNMIHLFITYVFVQELFLYEMDVVVLYI